MSVENAKAFIEKLKSDETLRDQIAQAGSDEERLQMATEAGFEFTVEEYNQMVNARGDEELSDEDLESVAGGGMQIFVKTWKLSGPNSTNVKYGDITLK